MATVYLARDLRHRRPVALKVLHPSLTSALSAERFLREIEVAANLSHPHILPLFDSGRVPAAEGQDELLYYVMPYVDGESLRDRLRREGQLPLDTALQIGRSVAGALAYAHAQGVIHRDIKPENILLSGYISRDGSVSGECHALVADFGIARAVAEPGAERLTDTGLAMGTAEYMSPEQATGGTVDGRSDVFSLGCVLYEMLAGEPPFKGPTMYAIIAQRFNLAAVPSVRMVRPTVSAGLEQAIMRAMAPIPADRFPTATALAAALQPTTSTEIPVPLPPPSPHRLRPPFTGAVCPPRRKRSGPPRPSRSSCWSALASTAARWIRRPRPGRSPCFPSRSSATRPTPTSPRGWRAPCVPS